MLLILNEPSLSFTSAKLLCSLERSLKSPVSQQLESKAFDTENEKPNEDEATNTELRRKYVWYTVKSSIWWQWGQWLRHLASQPKLQPVPQALLQMKLKWGFCHLYFAHLLRDLHFLSFPAPCFQVPHGSCSFTNRCFLTPCRWLPSCPPGHPTQFQHMPKSEQQCKDIILYFRLKYQDFLVAFGL